MLLCKDDSVFAIHIPALLAQELDNINSICLVLLLLEHGDLCFICSLFNKHGAPGRGIGNPVQGSPPLVIGCDHHSASIRSLGEDLEDIEMTKVGCRMRRVAAVELNRVNKMHQAVFSPDLDEMRHNLSSAESRGDVQTRAIVGRFGLKQVTAQLRAFRVVCRIAQSNEIGFVCQQHKDFTPHLETRFLQDIHMMIVRFEKKLGSFLLAQLVALQGLMLREELGPRTWAPAVRPPGSAPSEPPIG